MRNNLFGGFEDMIESGQSTVKSSAKGAVSDFANSAKGQISGSQSATPQDPDDGSGTNEHANADPNQQKPQMSDEDRVDFLKNLYGKSDNTHTNNAHKPQKGAGSVTQALGIPQKDPNAGKTPEEIVKMQALRSQLHADYYQNLINPPKVAEESVTEKLEKEDQIKAIEEDKTQKDRPGPLQNVKTGSGETMVSAG